MQVRDEAAGTLTCLSDAGRRPDIIAAGGVEALVELLMSDGTPQVQAQALRTINSVADDARSHAALAVALSTLVALAGGISGGSQRVQGVVQEYATSTMHKLAAGDDPLIQVTTTDCL